MKHLIIAVFALVLLNFVSGGPAQKRNKREVYPAIEPEKVEEIQPQVCVVGDLVYGAEETVPSEQPCLKCKCQPPGVHCEATSCQKKPGCRAIHKPNTCCPDYQCECEHEGKFYSNGERIEQKPGTECKVCYCRGGEVQCAEVSCYIRNDCEGRKVEGKCCPKYDHCPPREPTLDRTFSTEIANTTKETAIILENEINDTVITKPDKSIQTEKEQQITIQEIISPIKEIPITNSPKREISGTIQGQLLVEEQNNNNKEYVKLSTESNELEIPDAESDSSELAEIYQPPPVLRIGDKLLFLKKGEFVPEKDASTPSTIITIIGAEGLQRGFEDSIENHEVAKADGENKTQDFDNIEDDIQSVAESSHILSLIQRPGYNTKTSTEASLSLNKAETTTVDSRVASSSESTTEVLQLINTTDIDLDELYYAGNNSAIDIAVELPEYNPDEAEEMEATTKAANLSDVTTDISSESTQTYVTEFSTTSVLPKSTTEKEEVELNPEYPPIPDIMSPQNADEPIEHLEQEHKAQPTEMTIRILTHILPNNSNTPGAQNITNSNWLKQTVINTDGLLPDSLLNEAAVSDFDANSTDDNVASTTESKIQSKSMEIEKFGTEISNAHYTQNHIKALSANEEIVAGSTDAVPDLKSVESIEEVTVEDSGETVTSPTSQAASVIMNENASVEDMEGSTEMNMSDLVEMLPGAEMPAEAKSLEVETETMTTTVKYNVDEVEMIDPKLLTSHGNEEEKNITHEEDSMNKVVLKRQNDEDDKIFEELSHEIGLVSGTIQEHKTKEEEEKEAETIFKELLEESTSNTTPKPLSLQPRDRESAVLQRVSDAIAKFQLRDTKQSLDTSILGILRDFFSSQYRSYNTK